MSDYYLSEEEYDSMTENEIEEEEQTDEEVETHASSCYNNAFEHHYLDKNQLACWIGQRAEQLSKIDDPLHPKVLNIAMSRGISDAGILATLELFLNIPLTMKLKMKDTLIDLTDAYIPFESNNYLIKVYLEYVSKMIEDGDIDSKDLRINPFTGRSIYS